MIYPIAAFPTQQNPPYVRVRGILINPLTQPGSPIIWLPLLDMHPFSVSVEPDPVNGWNGSLQIFVSDAEQAPVASTFLFPTLGDVIAGPSSTMYDAPWAWIGAALLTQVTGGVHVFYRAAQFTRTFQP